MFTHIKRLADISRDYLAFTSFAPKTRPFLNMPIRLTRAPRSSPSVAFSSSTLDVLPARNDAPQLTRQRTTYATPAYLDGRMETRKVGLTRTGRKTTRVAKSSAKSRQPAKVSNVSYLAAGHEGCYFSRKQREMLSAGDATTQTSVRYVDCTAGSATAGHAVCNIQPRPRAAPYLARCEGDNCQIVTYGARDPTALQQISVQAEQQLKSQ